MRRTSKAAPLGGRVRRHKKRRLARVVTTCRKVTACCACAFVVLAIFALVARALHSTAATAAPPAAERSLTNDAIAGLDQFSGGVPQLAIPAAKPAAPVAPAQKLRGAPAQPPPAAAAPPPQSPRWLWRSSVDATEFAMDAASGAWVETSVRGGPAVHRYVGERTSVTRQTVVLYDEVRTMEVRLSATMGSFRSARSGALFQSFAQGRWVRVDGDVAPPLAPLPSTPPPPHLDGHTRETAKIFVGIAAHRDSMCGNTLKELFEHAKYPERIFPAVVQQNQPGDLDCITKYCELVPACRRGQVRIKRVDPQYVKGVMPARFQSELMIRDETFCLQIDSHMATEDDWDMLAIDQFMRSGNEMAVLSAYPNRERQRHDQSATPARCSAHFEGSGMPRGDSARNRPPSPTNGGRKNPDLVPFWGAGVSFSKCHADLMAPYDAHQAFLFSGEEFYHAARLFTHGCVHASWVVVLPLPLSQSSLLSLLFLLLVRPSLSSFLPPVTSLSFPPLPSPVSYDMYAPAINFIYHYYDDELPAFAQKDKVARRSFAGPEQMAYQFTVRTAAERRVRVILGWPLVDSAAKSKDAVGKLDSTELAYAGMGTRRSIESFMKFAKVDFEKRKITSQCNDIGQLKWVPFAYDKSVPFPPPQERCRQNTNGDDCCQTLDLAWEKGVASVEIHVKEQITRVQDHRADLYVGPIIDPLAAMRDAGASHPQRSELFAQCSASRAAFQASWWWQHSLATDPLNVLPSR